MSFVGPSGLAPMKQDLMHRITLYMHNQQIMVAHGVQDEVRGVGGKIACPFFNSDSSVHIQDGAREKMHHTDFFTCLHCSFSVCVISLIQSSCKCPALDAPSSNLLSRPAVLYHFFPRSSPVSLSSPLASSMSLCACVVRVCIALLAATRIVYALCVCILFATSILLSLRAPPDSSPRVSDCNITYAVLGGENAYGMGQGEGRRRVRKACTLSQNKGQGRKHVSECLEQEQ